MLYGKIRAETEKLEEGAGGDIKGQSFQEKRVGKNRETREYTFDK